MVRPPETSSRLAILGFADARSTSSSPPEASPRVEPAETAARAHADAALPHVVGDHYMVEHWLACYAVLLLS